MAPVLHLHILLHISIWTLAASLRDAETVFFTQFGGPRPRDWGYSVYDFTYFEDHILPKWIDRFTINYTEGRFSYYPEKRPKNQEALQGSIDVIDALDSVGKTASLTIEQR